MTTIKTKIIQIIREEVRKLKANKKRLREWDDEEEGDEDFEEEEEDFDDEPSEPQDEDIVIQDARGGGYYIGYVNGGSRARIGTTDDWDEAVKMANKQMKKDNYYPSLWYVDDRGSASPLDYKGNQI